METTIFDKILAGELPCDKVYEDETVLAFRDISPQAPIHVLVIPKEKSEGFHNLPEKEIEYTGKFFTAVAKVARLLDLEKDGYRIVLNHGEDGQQTVDYIHAHILGGRKLSWPPG